MQFPLVHVHCDVKHEALLRCAAERSLQVIHLWKLWLSEPSSSYEKLHERLQQVCGTRVKVKFYMRIAMLEFCAM